ncbi:MAG: glycosyltransferase, partial [Cyanobacteria bacterium J06635_13]
ISIGRLLHWKGFHLGLRGFAKANLPDAEYWLVGDGAERQRLEALAKELGIAAQVKFWGRLPRQETLEKLGQCQVLVHPSLHDSGGWVCLEGMAAKKPVLCLNLGGPGAQVTEATGIRVAPQTPEQVTTDLALAMKRLADNQELRQTMGTAGSQLVQEKYSLTARGRELSQLYTKLSAGLVTAV